jgi:hypothetical protein
VDYVRNLYHDEFINFSPHFSFCVPSHFSHEPNHHSYGFGSRESDLVPEQFGVTHTLIMVFVPRVGLVFPLEVSILTLR